MWLARKLSRRVQTKYCLIPILYGTYILACSASCLYFKSGSLYDGARLWKASWMELLQKCGTFYKRVDIIRSTRTWNVQVVSIILFSVDAIHSNQILHPHHLAMPFFFIPTKIF